MKFLLALSLLASSAVFAQTNGNGGHHGEKIKCYDSAQQNGDADLVLVLHASHHDVRIVFPRELRGIELELDRRDDCLESERHGGPGGSPVGIEPRPEVSLCETDGQRVNGLVPVELEVGNDDGTVYCEEEIEDLFHRRHGGGNGPM